jgi:hypothetical protein
LEDGQCGIGKDGRRHHTWPHSAEDIEFEDIIVVSDEVPPAPQLEGQLEGKSYTLWTEAHEQNQLVLNGRKGDIHLSSSIPRII